MQTITKTAKTIEQYADEIGHDNGQIPYLFQSKETRDAIAKLLTDRGFNVKRGSSHGSQLHPEYVTDFVGTYETGFGNTDYQTRWGNLYSLTVSSPLLCEQPDLEEIQKQFYGHGIYQP